MFKKNRKKKEKKNQLDDLYNIIKYNIQQRQREKEKKRENKLQYL